MKFALEATPEELGEKGEDLIRSLRDLLQYSAPETAELLEKALPTKEPNLKFPVLRGIYRNTKKEYQAMCERIVNGAMEIIEGNMGKSYDHSKAAADKDQEKYDELKKLLITYGYVDRDYEYGGVLYGWSTNQLIELLKVRREQNDE